MPIRGSCLTAIPGERFGRLLVTSADGKGRVCVCDCGTALRVAHSYQLKSGNTRSCGCLRKEVARATRLRHGATSGRSYTRAYSAWQGMIQRCSNPNNEKWSRYGGRGIQVCERWIHSFEAFLSDMGDPAEGLSLDRIDNDGPYSAENCRWASDLAQARNKSTNRILTAGGVSKTLAEWAVDLGLSRRTIATRLRLGWPVERALSRVAS